MTSNLPPLRQTPRRLFFLTLVLALVPFIATGAQTQAPAQPSEPGDIVGTWQGTLELPGSDGRPDRDLRIVLKITRAPNGSLTALNYSIDQSGRPMTTTDVTFRGRAFHYAVPSLGGSYDGHLDPESNTINGKWAHSMPLNFARTPPATAWEIPAPPPPRKAMTEQNPSFQVATIKPSDPANSGKYFRVVGRTYETHGTSLADLIQVSYGVNPKQIVNAPPWVHGDKFDLIAVPDGEGDPNGNQWLTMLRKLLSDRFDLVLHHEQQQLSTYVLTLTKDGPKNLTPSQSTSRLPGLEFSHTAGGLLLPARNATLGQFCQMLQQAVLDRPVVDHTGLTGKFDFVLTFAPGDSEFGGRPPVSAQQTDTPGLFEALQQQLGLKLTAEKLPSDVLVIDHVQKPSPN